MRGSRTIRRIGAIAALLIATMTVGADATPYLVVDVASGQILSQDQATQSWFPASTTKLMTTYVALDAVRAGRITLDTPIMMSPRATRMAPSKMGFRAGSEVTLYNALVMLMVKSANDIAVAIAEGVSGSVEAFADDMNRASASLGMTQSNWVNPNGLPDARQVTSARDLAILGRALLTHFPEYSSLYNIGAMRIGGSVTQTHNGLLGRYPGADGMKTGFTCPAGFNIVASATRGGQRLIAVVLGAPSANARTAKVAALLDRGFQSNQSLGALAALPAAGPTAAPDMRDSVCRNRGPAMAEFMAEVDELSAPTGSSSGMGIPLLDTLGGAQQQRLSARDIAQLPRPRFQPVDVYVGRAPGYSGPTARARAPGAQIGEQTDFAAYSGPVETGSAVDAAPMPRGRKASKQRPPNTRTTAAATPASLDDNATTSADSPPATATRAGKTAKAKSATRPTDAAKTTAASAKATPVRGTRAKTAATPSAEARPQ
jgi:D-alanyl-D-alanine carboxypeptidase